MTYLHDPAILQAVSLGYALLFVSASLHKFRHRQAFSGVLRSYNLLPVRALLLVSLLVPLAEILVAVGFFHSLVMVSFSGVLLRAVSARFRGRVMGIRMLAVYGLPVGLLASSGMVVWVGYAATVTLYVIVGVVFSVLIGYRWRRSFWMARLWRPSSRSSWPIGWRRWPSGG